MTMSLAEQAKNVAGAGRYGDTEILHLNKVELAGIASMMPLTKNPQTGHYEAFLPLLLGLGGALLGGSGALASVPILGGLGAAGMGALGSGLGTFAETGDIGQGLMSGLLGYGVGSLLSGPISGMLGESLAPAAAAAPAADAVAGAIPAAGVAPTATAAPVMSPFPIARPEALAGPISGAGAGAGSTGGGLGGLLSTDNMPLLIGGLSAAGSFLPPGANGAPKSGGDHDYERKRLERDRYNPAPDREGRENVYFGPSRYVPYADGGLVRGYGLGGIVKAFTNPFNELVQSHKDLIHGDIGGSLKGGLRSITEMASAPVTTVAGDQWWRQRLPYADSLYSMKEIYGAPRRGYADGGPVEVDGVHSIEADDRMIVNNAILAIRGRSPNPKPAIEAFIRRFGHQAFESLIQREAANTGVGGEQGQVSDGMSDGIAAINPDGAPAALSEGEFVVPADVVSGIGNGSTEAGARGLEDMISNIRQQRTGNPNSPDQIDPRMMMPT